MKTIQVYDPPMCCSTGICGTDINPDLVSFAALLAQLGTHGVKVERYNLGQQPMAFVQNGAVKALLDKEGSDANGAKLSVFISSRARPKRSFHDEGE